MVAGTGPTTHGNYTFLTSLWVHSGREVAEVPEVNKVHMLGQTHRTLVNPCSLAFSEVGGWTTWRGAIQVSRVAKQGALSTK